MFNKQSDELNARNKELGELTKTVEEYRKQVESTEQRHKEAPHETRQSLEAREAETLKTLEELQTEIESLQQQHTDELRSKDESIASHLEARRHLEDDMSNLQQRADQATADLERERSAHAEELQKNIDELRARAEDDLRAMEEEVSGHLKSLNGLQDQIAKLQQGETEGANLAQELHKQIKELKATAWAVRCRRRRY
jgi:chromosome segregation ATPase